MKRSQLLAVAIIISFGLSALPVAPAHAVGPYSEKLTAYVAGANTLWFMTFQGINVSAPSLTGVEGLSGVTSYNVTAIKTNSWSSDFQVFGPAGYDLVPTPFIPPEGLFLAVGASNFADASAAAGLLDSYFLTTFVSNSNGSGTYEFFSPLSFAQIVPSTLLRLLPTAMGGFAGTIVTSQFLGLQSPMASLSGVRTSSGFSHTLTLGSITTGGLDSASSVALMNYFGTTRPYIQASSKSSSSVVSFRFLDGVASSTDHATLVNDTTAFSGSETYTMTAGAKLFKLNTTVLQRPAQLLATRIIDTGVLRQSQNVSVTISLLDLSNSTSLSTITLSDDWWRASGLFKLVQGNSTVSIASLSAGKSTTPTYVLQYTGSASQLLSVPPLRVGYHFTGAGRNFQASTFTNPVIISLGADEPAVYAYAAPTGGFGLPVGGSQQLKVVVKNVGTRAASGVTVAGKQLGGGGLAADGGSATVTQSVTATGLLGINVSRSYAVSYTTPEGQTVTLSTNPVTAVFSHTSMRIGFPTLFANSTLSYSDTSSVINLTLTFVAGNNGIANVTSFLAHAPLPSGLGCGTAKGPGIQCSASEVTLNYSVIQPKIGMHASLQFNLTTPANYLVPPLSYSARMGFNVTGESNSLAIPTGFMMSKQLSPSSLFGGMTSKVGIAASNSGPFALYNATVRSTVDAFDTLLPSSRTSSSAQKLEAGGNLSFTYSVTATFTPGSYSGSPVAGTFYFGGRSFSLSQRGPVATVFSPLSASIVATPATPTEGRTFVIQVLISNPASVEVSNVAFALPIPEGVTLSSIQNAAFSNGDLTVIIPLLAGGSSYNASATGLASSGTAIVFDEASLTFHYGGATVSGKLPTQGIAIGEDVLARYYLPMGLVFIALLATALVIRRRAAPSVPASQQ